MADTTAKTTSFLTPTQRYAAGALFAFSLHHAQINQTRPLGSFFSSDDDDPSSDNRISSGSCSSSTSTSSDSVADDPDLWVHEVSGLLRPVFRFLEIESVAWSGLEETAGSSPAKNHVGAFLRLLAEEENGENSSQDQQLALSKAVDAMGRSMKKNPEASETKKEKYREYVNECKEKCSTAEVQSNLEEAGVKTGVKQKTGENDLVTENKVVVEKPIEEVMLSYERKVTVLYELLTACLADTHVDSKKSTRKRKGYDARHRVALRLLATWLDVKWINMEAIETIVACSAMALAKEKEESNEVPDSSKGKWAKWKRGGIIGAAALTGGTLLAITGGLAAPAIAAGLGALAPTLGTLVPVIGAGGFAAVASAAGTVAGSVAVAASFGGSKMARRTGSVDEFEFKVVGEENHNQGRLAVGIMISGLVFNEEDFVRPWEVQDDNSERYVLQWESKNLIAVSTAIQDWLTSRIALELMKQGAMMTVLSTLVAALAWPATLLAVTDFIDSTWSIAVDRSDKAGRLLAEVLLKGVHGNRPVTLVGYSLGARVIFKCLQFLAETEKNERVVLLGAPISIKDENWGAARKVDVTDLIEGHSSYLWATQQILELLELDTYYPVFRAAKQSTQSG
ncbi:hypothetical protein CsatB_024689 [Cannabis sativa]